MISIENVTNESMIPSNLFAKAELIVQKHHPKDPLLEGFDPQLRLSDADHQTLNGGQFTLYLSDEDREEIFVQLRIKYAGDLDALKEIDVFDTKSLEFKRIGVLLDSLQVPL